ncbi:hypothetical protein SCHPADRAFT_936161 [Schizopora paradoxa]|uniref:DUF6533 domain-containing protein n=1 Tax=Schizopora paradoxa TaxID=27342 RepID=A0A0H2S9X7_9AGAM|nr:hypothetical protein SCHPADRAFT_936161 [Schizopora paradoxa]
MSLSKEDLQVLRNLQFVKLFNVAFYALMIYDYVVSLSDEINFIWPGEWRLGKTLYVINRYLVFVDPAVTLMYLFGTNTNVQTCNGLASAIVWLAVIGSQISQLILSMRTYAIWGKSLTVLSILLTIHVALLVSEAMTIRSFLKTFKYGHSLANIAIACTPISSKSHVWIAYLFIVVLELTIVILTIYKAYATWHRGISALTITLYRDGLRFNSLSNNYIAKFPTAIMCFCLLFVMSIVNEVLQADPSLAIFYDLFTEYVFGSSLPQRIMQAILSGKIILHLRRETLCSQQTQGDGSVTLPQRTFISEFQGPEAAQTMDNNFELIDRHE